MTEKKYCVNCKHFRKDKKFSNFWLLLLPVFGWLWIFFDFFSKDSIKFGKCSLFKRTTKIDDRYLSKTFDNDIKFYQYASSVRWNTYMCGSEAKFYEDKK